MNADRVEAKPWGCEERRPLWRLCGKKEATLRSLR
jgi:hypothetical protein